MFYRIYLGTLLNAKERLSSLAKGNYWLQQARAVTPLTSTQKK
jgi:hypothetical protein